uniref:Uncharacterized protein n=1 Tax=Paramormyrops kingsleyae TaxID=1676925 RepID=A0A3B3RME0_9TELE
MAGRSSYGLPFLPGNSFRDVSKSAFHRPQTLSFKNGYALPLRPTVGIGKEPLQTDPLTQSAITHLHSPVPALTYDRPSPEPVAAFIPAHVTLDKKVSVSKISPQCYAMSVIMIMKTVLKTNLIVRQYK